MGKPKKSEKAHDFYASVKGVDGEEWHLHYYDMNGEKQIMLLDADQGVDAQSEAASFLGIEKDEIEIEYD